jgi:putative transposase
VQFRLFNLIDDFNCEVPAIEIDLSLPLARVIRALKQVTAYHDKPAVIHFDNAPKYASVKIHDCAKAGWRIKLENIQPGKPQQVIVPEKSGR